MQAFPLPPTPQLDRHIEIGNGSCSVQSEVEDVKYKDYSLSGLMTQYTQSLYVHDVSTCSNTMAKGTWYALKWCRVERCSNLDAVFPPGADECDNLETIWASDLLKAHCIWSQGLHRFWYFRGLRQLHLRSCPSLRFAIPVFRPSFPSLESLHITHCGDLRHIFVLEKKSQTSVEFPRLTTIHLHDLPALQQICEATKMPVPVLETIKIRGCPNLRRLPALKGRKPGMKRPTVEVGKDVWDALKWDGMDAGHHPSLYEAPVHSRYYKRRFLRHTVLSLFVKQTKTDKISLLGSTIEYVKQLEEKVKTLEGRRERRTSEPTVFESKCRISSTDSDASCSSGSAFGAGGFSPTVEASIHGDTVLLKICCLERRGVLVMIISELENQGLSIINTSVLPFTNSCLNITITAKIGAGFLSTVELITNLTAALKGFST